MKRFVAAAGASPSLRVAELQDRFIAVRCPAANGLSRIFEELHGFAAARPRRMPDSLMTRCFRHRVLWDRDPNCLPADVQPFGLS
ncbi:exported hypothetical protein [Candidatus Sulfopaludibacter sp. SbA6]|nr:exported hypothetical protein [Candidatus Sulfopaludibacter sp. SbA6]